jgi:hypothetical protein
MIRTSAFAFGDLARLNPRSLPEFPDAGLAILGLVPAATRLYFKL